MPLRTDGASDESRPSVSSSACVLESGRLEAPRRRRRTASRAAPTATHDEVDSRNHATTLTHVPVSTVRVRRRKGRTEPRLRDKTNGRARAESLDWCNAAREPEAEGEKRGGAAAESWKGGGNRVRKVAATAEATIDASTVAHRCRSVETPRNRTRSVGATRETRRNVVAIGRKDDGATFSRATRVRSLLTGERDDDNEDEDNEDNDEDHDHDNRDDRDYDDYDDDDGDDHDDHDNDEDVEEGRGKRGRLRRGWWGNNLVVAEEEVED